MAENIPKVLQTVLTVLSVGGMVLWLCLSALAWFFHGFKAGEPHGGLSVAQGIFCTFTPVVVFGYYFFVAANGLTKITIFVGVGMIALSVAVYSVLQSNTDASPLAALFLFPSAVTWMLLLCQQGGEATDEQNRE